MDDLINVPNVQEDVSADNEILEQSMDQAEGPRDQVAEPEPLIIETKGKWQPFEAMTGQELEVGKTYNIKVQGKCEFMISKDRPTFGIQTNEFPYTKQEDTRLWIKTGG